MLYYRKKVFPINTLFHILGLQKTWPSLKAELGMDDRMSGAPGDPILLCQDPTYPREEAMRGNQEAVLGSNTGFSRVTAPAASSSKQYNALSSAPRVHFFRTQDSLQNV